MVLVMDGGLCGYVVFSVIKFIEEKHLLNQQWIHLWALPGKNKKLWPRKVTGTIKCGKRSRGIETDGGKYIDRYKG